MDTKQIQASSSKEGNYVIFDNIACVVKSIEKSKTGKHGSMKCRIEAVNIITGNKKVLACPGAERFEVPMIEKKKAQILSLAGDKASVMDLESYETIEIPYLQELKDKLLPEKQVEYWDIEGKKIIMRVL